jgi:hypothetical protein
LRSSGRLRTRRVCPSRDAAFNDVNAAAGKLGAFYDIPRGAALDDDLARTVMEGSEFIFDVHGHFANPTGAWLKKVPQGRSPVLDPTPDISAERFIKDVFLDSDTDMMVLTFIPSMSDAEPLTIEEAAATQKIIDDLEGTKRLLIHGRVAPNQAGDLDRMEHLAKKFGVVGWKTYTQWGPADNAYYSLQTGLGYSWTTAATGPPSSSAPGPPASGTSASTRASHSAAMPVTSTPVATTSDEPPASSPT